MCKMRAGKEKEFDAQEVVRKIMPEQAEKIELVKAARACFGLVFINEQKVIENVREKVDIEVKRVLWITVPLMMLLLAPIPALLVGAAQLGFSTLVPPLTFFIGMLLYTLVFLRKNTATKKEVEKIASAMPGPEKKYILIYHSPKTLIHELLHIKKGHLEEEKPKISRLAEDYIVERETRKLLKELRKK